VGLQPSYAIVGLRDGSCRSAELFCEVIP
jgi:hypothetical protein